MPFAKGVSAKSHDFDAEGNETQTDYLKMMKIVLDAGYRGYVGIEYEGGKLSEPEGHQGDEEAAGAGAGADAVEETGVTRRPGLIFLRGPPWPG